MKQVLHPVCNLSRNLRLITFFPAIFGTGGSQLYTDRHLAQATAFRDFKTQQYLPSCANYFTSSCLFPLTPRAEYLDYKSFQPRILTLCLLKPDLCQSECIRSKLILIFTSLTCTMILGISTKHTMLLQEKNPTAMPRVTTGT